VWTGIAPAVWEEDPRAMATALELLDEAEEQRNQRGVTVAGETA
jgi:hypothetical protein